jgi:hypothetical protein
MALDRRAELACLYGTELDQDAREEMLLQFLQLPVMDA